MLKLIYIGILSLLLCSCMHQQNSGSGINWDESIARAEAKRALWDKKFEQLPGTHINELIAVWGEPEKLKNNEYRWRHDSPIQIGGYYEPDGYTSSKVYEITDTGITKHVGYIDTPKERYVAPWTIENWCEIHIATNKKGIITHASYTGDYSGGIFARSRAALFPLP